MTNNTASQQAADTVTMDDARALLGNIRERFGDFHPSLLLDMGCLTPAQEARYRTMCVETLCDLVTETMSRREFVEFCARLFR